MFRELEPRPVDRIAGAYLCAKQSLIESGYAHEIDWMDALDFDAVDECTFLREAAWVILSSGLAERVVRKRFPSISGVFFDWQSAERIIRQRKSCRRSGLRLFNSPPKIDAIIETAAHLKTRGFRSVKEALKQEGPAYLLQLPYMGPATSRHLAKNIGFQEVKPDRHLTRLAAVLGYDHPLGMCTDIALAVGEKLSVVDLVLWRYATLNADYLDYFRVSSSTRAGASGTGLGTSTSPVDGSPRDAHSCH